MNNSKYLVDAAEAMNVLGVSRTKAYDILHDLNKELEQAGFIIVKGKVPRPYWDKRFYDYKNFAV